MSFTNALEDFLDARDALKAKQDTLSGDSGWGDPYHRDAALRDEQRAYDKAELVLNNMYDNLSYRG